MKATLFAAIAALASTGFAATAAAQNVAGRAGPSLAVTPYAGYMVFGNLVSGPLGSRITAANGPVFGAQLELALTPSVAVVGNLAHTSTSLEAGLPILGDHAIGTNAMWLYDGGLQLKLPRTSGLSSAVTPFLQAGAGAMQYNVSVAGLGTKATSFAGNVGLGADLAFGQNVALRFMAKDYIGKFDLREAVGIDADPKTAHHFALSAGLKLGF